MFLGTARTSACRNEKADGLARTCKSARRQIGRVEWECVISDSGNCEVKAEGVDTYW